MKYFLDTEFLEGTQKTLFGKTKPTIDLISIGIVAEDGREYYAISKEFNLKEAWNRWQQRTGEGDRNNTEPRLYWLRDNVLKPIFNELFYKEYLLSTKLGSKPNLVYSKFEYNNNLSANSTNHFKFTYDNFKKLINKYGKTNRQIAEEIKGYVGGSLACNGLNTYTLKSITTPPEFYAYYADYDWVVFCWLFGLMKDLPKGFPYYCRDLQQTLDELQQLEDNGANHMIACGEIGHRNVPLKERKNYPKQTNEHNALADARWNFELYKFLNTI
jgi:hypothetical protein